jgi:hypothetical protein
VTEWLPKEAFSIPLPCFFLSSSSVLLGREEGDQDPFSEISKSNSEAARNLSAAIFEN